MEDSMLTTIDNPYDPFTQFNEWNTYDIEKGYNTNGLIARIVALRNGNEPFNDDLEEDIATVEAMNEIVELDPVGKYIKVFKDQENKPNQ